MMKAYHSSLMNKMNIHTFSNPKKKTKQAIDYNSFNPRLITENNLHDDNRHYRYEQNLQEQPDAFINNNNDEEDNNNEEYILDQNENRNETMVLNVNENKASEYTTPESTTSAQNASQAEASTTNQFVRVTTRVVSPRQNTHNPQSSPDTSQNRYKTFTFPPSPEEEITQDRTQNITNTRDISAVNVLSPTKTNNTGNKTHLTYEPPSIPSVFKHSTRTDQSENIHNNNQQTSTSSQLYDPLNYSFFSPFITNTQPNNTQNVSQSNNNIINSMTQHPYAHILNTNEPQNNFLQHTKRTSYSNIVQPSQRRSQNPSLSHISTDPLYQMNQHTTNNPTTLSPPVNKAQPVVPPSQYIPIQQDTFKNTSPSKPEPMKPFGGLDHSYTPEEYLQQVEARLTFAIGE